MYFFSLSYALSRLTKNPELEIDFIITSTMFPEITIEILMEEYSRNYSLQAIERIVSMKDRVFQPRLSGVNGMGLMNLKKPFTDHRGYLQTNLPWCSEDYVVPREHWPSWLTELVDENNLGL